jgi:alpha-mannosidase
MTTKISWNQYNHLPSDSFRWQGLDGTQVLTHMITTPEASGALQATYNGDLSPGQVINTWCNYQQKETHTELLTAFGYGDGGGGPTREMLEKGRRLPVWNGELYLEYHRGTNTSQARNKRANRKREFLVPITLLRSPSQYWWLKVNIVPCFH